jgi:hypothetical protein
LTNLPFAAIDDKAMYLISIKNLRAEYPDDICRKAFGCAGLACVKLCERRKEDKPRKWLLTDNPG